MGLNEKRLFGENTDRVKNFAVISATNITYDDLTPKQLKNHLHCFKADLDFYNIQHTEISDNLYILYNLTQHDTADFASRYKVKTFLYGENKIPSEITLYIGIIERVLISYQEERKTNINSLGDAEEICGFEMNEDFLKAVRSADNEIIDEDELRKSLQPKRSYSSRHMHRQAAQGKEDGRMSVIFAKPMEKPTLIKHRLRVINRYFQIYENIKLSIPNAYWFDGAVRVYDAYRDRERFLKAINGFAEICRIDSYFIVEKNSNIWKADRKNDTITQISGMEIIDDNAHRVGNIMGLALGAVLNGCPELEKIVDSEYVK